MVFKQSGGKITVAIWGRRGGFQGGEKIYPENLIWTTADTAGMTKGNLRGTAEKQKLANGFLHPMDGVPDACHAWCFRRVAVVNCFSQVYALA